jgi:hypothetical protein
MGYRKGTDFISPSCGIVLRDAQEIAGGVLVKSAGRFFMMWATSQSQHGTSYCFQERDLKGEYWYEVWITDW